MGDVETLVDDDGLLKSFGLIGHDTSEIRLHNGGGGGGSGTDQNQERTGLMGHRSEIMSFI